MLRAFMVGTPAQRAAFVGTGIVAFVIAEMFFKWRSFSLECGGFLATWAVLEGIASRILARFAKPVTQTL